MNNNNYILLKGVEILAIKEQDEKNVYMSGLIKATARKSGRSQAIVKDVLRGFADAVIEILSQGKNIKMYGIGTLTYSAPHEREKNDLNNAGKRTVFKIPAKIRFKPADVYNNKLTELLEGKQQ